MERWRLEGEVEVGLGATKVRLGLELCEGG